MNNAKRFLIAIFLVSRYRAFIVFFSTNAVASQKALEKLIFESRFNTTHKGLAGIVYCEDVRSFNLVLS